MADKSNPRSNLKTAQSRDDRLKAALKANLARRKAQARARSEGTADKTGKNEG
jgi:hypothetical protein